MVEMGQASKHRHLLGITEHLDKLEGVDLKLTPTASSTEALVVAVMVVVAM